MRRGNWWCLPYYRQFLVGHQAGAADEGGELKRASPNISSESPAAARVVRGLPITPLLTGVSMGDSIIANWHQPWVGATLLETCHAIDAGVISYGYAPARWSIAWTQIG
jgi:hypothetical protein